MAKKKTKGKTQDEKHKDFVRVVTPRVKKALKAIALIGNQSGAAYAYTEDEVTKIFGTLQDEIAKAEKRYQGGDSQEVDFSLD